MEEAAVNQLKEKRSKAKSHLTAICNKLMKRKNIPFTDIQAIHKELESAYDHFLEQHYEYASAVSDDKFSSHRIVAGLPLDDYLAHSEQLYNETIDYYAECTFKYFSRDANTAIQKAELLLESDDKSGDFYSLVTEHISIVKELCHRFEAYPTDDTAPILVELDKVRLDLECIQVGSTRTHSFDKSAHVDSRPFNQSTSSHIPPSSLSSASHLNSNPSTSQSIDSTPGIRFSVEPTHESTHLPASNAHVSLQ